MLSLPVDEDPSTIGCSTLLGFANLCPGFSLAKADNVLSLPMRGIRKPDPSTSKHEQHLQIYSPPWDLWYPALHAQSRFASD